MQIIGVFCFQEKQDTRVKNCFKKFIFCVLTKLETHVIDHQYYNFYDWKESVAIDFFTEKHYKQKNLKNKI